MWLEHDSSLRVDLNVMGCDALLRVVSCTVCPDLINRASLHGRQVRVFECELVVVQD